MDLNANNDAMVGELVESHALQSEECIAAFKAVDRGHFWPPQGSELAYSDMPLRHGRLHLSAPHIYGKALESLMPLKPGMSFLNIGSGTGYFNCIVSQFTGHESANHGVEIWPETVAHAKERSAAIGKPYIEYNLGNIYQLDVNSTMRYDRIYIGACANSRSKYLYRLLEVGGVLIGPFQAGHSQQLRRVVRQTETQFFVEVLGSVQFACLVEPQRSVPQASPVTAARSPAVFAPPPRAQQADSGSTTPATVSSGEGIMADDGQQPVGLPGVPFTFSLMEIPWTPERSWLYPASFKQAVATGLLCRPKERGVVGLPVEIWIKHIIPWCSKRWFEAKPAASPLPAMITGEGPADLVLPPALGSKGEELEDGFNDGASTRAPSSGASSAQTTPDRGPSQPPVDVVPQADATTLSFSEDTLFEVWSNGQRHAIGAEGDPDDLEPDRGHRMAVPHRVLQLLAEEATRRQRRRRRDDEEPEEEEDDQDDEALAMSDNPWRFGSEGEEDEGWEHDGDDFDEMEMDSDPWHVDRDIDMQVEEDVNMF
eukprot:TRINITY_DN106570_c0_g1_i1.p1 TRINITY_DN106570_c0_g1~~TRINITY_DN106570_c0_g1_i1.p1  ORF type:complete len:540 (+),score=124.11 TRINITY_DN106570_c0_g1_i1:206-1825(+)